MVKEIIDKAIKTEGIIEFVYSKDGVNDRFFQLSDVMYSSEHGINFISGTPLNSDTELTFRIDKIKKIQLMWNDVYCERVQLKKGGIYLVEFLGDNYIDFAIKDFKGGEELSASTYRNYLDFVLEYADFLSYHYLPYYSATDTNFWKPYDKIEKVQYPSICVFAYTLEEKTTTYREEVFVNVPSSSVIKNLEHSGIRYTAVFLDKWKSLNEVKLREGVTILAVSRLCEYTMKNLSIRNSIM